MISGSTPKTVGIVVVDMLEDTDTSVDEMGAEAVLGTISSAWT